MAPQHEHQARCSVCRQACWRQKVLSTLLLFLLSIALVACTTGSTPPQATRQPTSTRRPTPAGPPSGSLLYQSNWSHGLAGWHASQGWKLVAGMALSNLSSNNSLTVPYLSSVPNYRLEVRFQIVSVPHNGGSFVVTADRTPDKDGYTAGILDLLSPAPHNQFTNPQIQVFLNPESDMTSPMGVSDYEPGSQWHTYDIEVNGSTVTLRIDGVAISSATSTQTNVLSNGPFHVVSSQAIVRVSSVRVTVF